MRFVQGKVVRRFRLKGKEVVFRYPKASDAPDMVRHINSVIGERACIILQKKLTLKGEKKWLKETIGEIEKGHAVMLCAIVDGKYAGGCEVRRRHPGGISHVGKLGIILGRDYRNLGIGTELIKATEGLAKAQMKTEIMRLSFFNDNSRARHVYEKMGYREIGKVQKGLKHYGKYCDEVLMAKRLK